MKNEDNQKKIKINKLKISNLFFEMNPLREPKIRIKLAEDLFLNNFLQNNFPLREYYSLSDRKQNHKFDLQKIKYAYDFSTGQIASKNYQNNINKINTIMNIQNNNPNNNFLITSLKLSINNNKFLKNKIKDDEKKQNNYFHKKYKMIDKGIQKGSYLNKNKSNLNKLIAENMLNKKIKDIKYINMKRNLSLNCLEKNINNNYENNYIINNNYDIRKYYRNNMILPKITKTYLMPSFENNKSKEIKDLYSLKQYEMKEIEESMKLKPFIH